MDQNKNFEETADQVPNYKMIDGKYYIKQQRLGNGCLAVTHLATQKENEKIVYACKMLSKSSLIQQFQRNKGSIEDIKNNLIIEVNLWKQLYHPNITKIFYITETLNNLYFFLEYCNGGDLITLMRSKLSEKEAIDIFNQISDGFCYLNDLNIIHRDIKPYNILIHNGIVKITDLGFANFVEKQSRDLYVCRNVIPIPLYKSPQEILSENYSIKSNVWSLGVIFYQILYEKDPWGYTQSIMEFIKAITSEAIQFPNTHLVSDEMKELISKMLQVKEEDRIDIKGVSESLRKMNK